jgi:S-DNA-T family DNA segregation ATPase FtsK/SpoIIIE
MATQSNFLDEAIKIVTNTQRASVSLIQRRLRIGYFKASQLMEEMERRGIVSKLGEFQESPRRVLVPSNVAPTETNK